ncbi:homeodomain-interacting protein kinase 3-like protein [Lates japonicus]|uniref:Homeodomain-interacting protein kinase 3-like protein n=1 Tax=Lates japonicus TaxID=270547 RepID=A0AAD3MPG6_LATJO|nr:homeodomain-interacting protein kinase 3-like protein [Lates japonicus]
MLVSTSIPSALFPALSSQQQVVSHLMMASNMVCTPPVRYQQILDAGSPLQILCLYRAVFQQGTFAKVNKCTRMDDMRLWPLNHQELGTAMLANLEGPEIIWVSYLLELLICGLGQLAASMYLGRLPVSPPLQQSLCCIVMRYIIERLRVSHRLPTYGYNTSCFFQRDCNSTNCVAGTQDTRISSTERQVCRKRPGGLGSPLWISSFIVRSCYDIMGVCQEQARLDTEESACMFTLQQLSMTTPTPSSRILPLQLRGAAWTSPTRINPHPCTQQPRPRSDRSG